MREREKYGECKVKEDEYKKNVNFTNYRASYLFIMKNSKIYNKCIFNFKIYTRLFILYELYYAFIWEYSCLLICLQNTLFAAFVPILLNYGQSATNYLFRKYLLYRVLFAYSYCYICVQNVSMLYPLT